MLESTFHGPRDSLQPFPLAWVQQQELPPLNVSSVIEVLVVGVWLSHVLARASVH